MVHELVNLPMFGIALTLITFSIGVRVNQRLRTPVANPLLICILLSIGFLLLTGIGYDSYNQGGQIISFFLGPATVALGVPLYRQLDTIKKNKIPVLVGTFVGSMTAILSVIALVYVTGGSREIMVSLSPKSVTTPIALEVSSAIGGIPALTVVAVVITGVIGAMFGPEILQLAKVKNKVAIGLAIGTASHALGTSRAIKEGEVEGAFSSAAIGLAGIITALILPLILRIPFWG